MRGKKSESKFTIQFNRLDSSHIQVADILNRQQRYGKAQYIVDAVIHYINCGLNAHDAQTARIDERHIEAVVCRILKSRQDGSADKAVLTAANASIAPAASSAGDITSPLPLDDGINLSDSVDAIGEDGFTAIANALDMFRSK